MTFASEKEISFALWDQLISSLVKIFDIHPYIKDMEIRLKDGIENCDEDDEVKHILEKILECYKNLSYQK